MIEKIQYEEKDYFERIDRLYSFCKESNDYRELFTNLIVVDLVTNFEVFIERTLRAFKKSYNKKKPTNCMIPEMMKIEHSRKVLGEINTIINHEHKKDKTKSLLSNLSDLWSSTVGTEVKIDFEAKYPRGKHGEFQLKKLFQKIDIQDIFSLISIPSKQISILTANEELDVDEFISNITSKRNLAIHEGSPLQNTISLVELEDLIETTRSIMFQINDLTNKKLVECFEIVE